VRTALLFQEIADAEPRRASANHSSIENFAHTVPAGRVAKGNPRSHLGVGRCNFTPPILP
jgi:hypothetical protein